MENATDLYREEAAELIASLEIALLELERRPDDRETVDTVFRALHTIKGSGAMFGYDAVASFTHEIESAFDLVRAGELRVSQELINITLAARDHIKALLDGAEPSGEEILSRLATLLARKPREETTQVAAQENQVAAQEKTWRIRYTAATDCLINGSNPLLLLNELRELGNCDVQALTGNIPGLREIDPDLCYVAWDIILTTSRPERDIRDVFLFIGDDEVRMEAADHPGKNEMPRLGEILVEKGDVSRPQVEAVLASRPRTGELLVERKIVDREKIDSALLEQEHIRERRERQEQAESNASIRVSADKLDSLANIVGELVTVQARLSQVAGASGDPEINFVAEEVERLTGKLRDNAMSIRMLPIGTAFNRFRRVVRDLSRDLGKEVELIAEGGETELDKTVIERLHDPLVHIIRNSMDHGIESPGKREEAGKSRQGRICLSAEHSGTSVLIRITDDGAGLNTAAIRERAIERGLISASAELPDDEIHALIIQPGFSTAREVTGISGRGVGMDVVQRAIESLRGSLQIASARGKGTTITLRLPLTLAIIDGLLVQIDDGFYVLPLSSILECIELGPEERRQHGGKLVVIRNEPVGCIRLRDIFAIPGEGPALEQVVIAETPEGKFGFVVDLVVGDHQTVIKPLSGFYRNIQFISGATILGDGSIALIVDVDKLASLALADRNRARSQAQIIPNTAQAGNNPVAQL